MASSDLYPNFNSSFSAVEFNAEVSPLVELPDFITGWRGESTRSALDKYNQHTHSLAGSVSFLQQGAAVGDEIAMTTDRGLVFPENTTAIEILPHRLTASTNAAFSANTRLVLAGQKIFKNCYAQKDSPYIYFERPVRGMVEGKTINALALASYTGSIVNPAINLRYPIILRAAAPSYVQSLVLHVPIGSLTITAAIEDSGRNLKSQFGPYAVRPGSDYFVDLSRQTESETSYLDIDYSLVLILSDIEADSSLFYTANLLKTLPQYVE